MEEFRRYLELRNYQKKNIQRVLSCVKEYEEYRAKGNPPSEYITYLKQRKNKKRGLEKNLRKKKNKI